MRVRCAGCGRKVKIGFTTWWMLWKKLQLDQDLYWHWQCEEDMRNQRRIDGLDR